MKPLALIISEWLLPALLQVSQGGATEKLAHQVPASTPATHRRPKAATGHAHAEEEDETYKSSEGHIKGKYGSWPCLSAPQKKRGCV